MRLFELNWSWFEEYQPYLFVHTDPSKTKEDFESDVRRLFPISATEEIEESLSAEYGGYIGMNRITERVAQNLPSLGYIRVEPETFGTFGNYIIKTGDSEESKEAIDLIGGFLFQRAVEINEKISRGIKELTQQRKTKTAHTVMKFNRKYTQVLLVGLIPIILAMTIIFWPKKEFPVKVGQVWECTMNVIPFIDNKAQNEVTVTYHDSVYKIDTDAKIYYIRNGADSLDSDLENFTFQSTLMRK